MAQSKPPLLILALCACAVLGVPGLYLAGFLIKPPPEFADSIEDPSLKSRAHGVLVFGDGSGYFVQDLVTGLKIKLEPQESVYSVAGPAQTGTVFAVENDMMGKRHMLCTLTGTRRQVLLTRPGDALWGTFRTQPIGEYAAMSPDGTTVALLTDLVNHQYPGALMEEGALTLIDMRTGALRTVAHGVINMPLSWFPDGHNVLCTVARDAAGREETTIARVDVSSGSIERLIPAQQGLVSPSGKRAFVGDFQAGQWYDFTTKTLEPTVLHKRAVAVMDDQTVLIRELPSKGFPTIYEMHGKGPRLTTTLKLYDTKSGHVLSLVPGIITWSRISYRP